MTARIKTGTAAWADRRLVETGWYPEHVRSAEAKLRYYASQFPLVENDSTYWAFPDAGRVAKWSERTPAGFTMSIKAHALLTQHYANPRSLPRDLREALPREIQNKARVYPKDLGPEVMHELEERFLAALAPLVDADKLGVVLFQYPVWFPISHANKAELHRVRERFAELRVAIELRNETWMTEDNRRETLDFLEGEELIYVCVDEPQGFVASVPPVVAATSDVAVIRMHGRNPERWRQRSRGRAISGPRAHEWTYLYSEAELQEWAARIRALATRTEEVHVIFSNAPLENAVQNARELAELVAAARPPRRHATRASHPRPAPRPPRAHVSSRRERTSGRTSAARAGSRRTPQRPPRSRASRSR